MATAQKIATINFMHYRNHAFIVSALLFILSIGSLATQGLNLGIDFTGGTLIEISYTKTVDLANVRARLAAAGFDNATIQYFGGDKDVLVRLAPQAGLNNAQLSSEVLKVLASVDPDVSMRRIEFVGPQVGDELKNDGGLALLYALIGVLVYVAIRFQLRFSVGAIAALVHDVVITIGIFSLLGLDFDLTVLAALLAVIGYSLNDTIVVFDRVRENFRRFHQAAPIEVFNISINQTLKRTLITSLTTLLVLISLFVVGGEIIHNFSLALIIGVLIGTYSSIFIASSTTLKLGISRTDLMPVKKEEADG